MLKPLFGSFATLAVAALVACSGSMGGSTLPPQSGPGSSVSAPQEDAPQDGALDASPSEPGPSGSAQAPGGATELSAAAAGTQTASAQHRPQPYHLQGRLVPMLRLNAARALCPRPTHPHQMQCFALIRTDIAPLRERDLVRRHYMPAGYGPKDLQNAYRLSPAAGGGTVAIVDAFYYPKAASDLAIYRKTYGLPACTVSNGCLRIVNQNGQPVTAANHPPLSPPHDDWSGEQALDLDAVSAVCPNCRILLVESNSDYTSSLDSGVDAAAALSANAISNSYGGKEYSASDPAFVHPGIAITAASGDSGAGNGYGQAGAQQPCSFATVVCVGGTSLRLSPGSARGWSETAWPQTGSGCSLLVSKPAWQHDRGCAKRSEADVSASADPSTGIAVYVSTYGGWTVFGGTSESTPIVAAVFALAGNTASVNGPQTFWQHNGAGLFHVFQGNNEVAGAWRCPSSMRYICYAGPGYNGPTGWGTPNGTSAF
jgi:hypothetical protein